MAKSTRKNMPVKPRLGDRLTLEDALELGKELCHLDGTSLRSEVEEALKEQFDISLDQLLKVMRPLIMMTPLSEHPRTHRCFHAFVKYNTNYSDTKIVSIIDVNLP